MDSNHGTKQKHEWVTQIKNQSINQSIKMKTSRLYILLILSGFILSSCSVDTIRVDANDEVTYRNVYITDYSSIEIANGFTAYITFSNTEESIKIETNSIFEVSFFIFPSQ